MGGWREVTGGFEGAQGDHVRSCDRYSIDVEYRFGLGRTGSWPGEMWGIRNVQMSA